MQNEIVKLDKFEIDVGDTGHITNCYFVTDADNNLCVIDPADKAQDIVTKIEEKKLNIKCILLTHCHSDHICAVSYLTKKYPNVKVYIHENDVSGLNESDINCEDVVGVKVREIDTNNIICVKDKDVVSVGSMTFEVIHTPGHTKGSCVFLEKNLNVLFTGDTVFSNTYGRTDLKTGSHDDMRHSLDKLFSLFDNITCFSGHGEEFVLSNVKRKINLLFAFKG